ncbi:MAG: TetR/AcrR family transcriptional regulator [Bacilli bacterium]|nr:TetR/AcrR family transcriptional regulator [Bacilli bacterium]MBO6286023.1 TetR/AcrR family transcriptional regulator [Bacilli bacterium]
MSQYLEAREKTIEKIEQAYFGLYIKERKITVSEICKIAGIHRSTFYFYFEWVDDVLNGIKDRLYKKLTDIIDSEDRQKGDFRQIQINLRAMFKEERYYLIPLVLEQRGGKFAIQYRELIKERFAEDLGIDYKTGNDVKNDVANCVLSGMIEIMLYELSSEIIPEEYTYIIGRGIIDKGVLKTLKDDLNIKIGR